MFSLLYHQHGGSGLNVTLQDVLGMELVLAEDFLERMNEERRQEAAAIKSGARRGRR